METNINIGLIDCSKRAEISRAALNGNLNGYNVRKILTVTKKVPENSVSREFPGAQLVDDVKSIINDSSIDLILVSKPNQTDIDMVGEAIQAGKNVRIIQ